MALFLCGDYITGVGTGIKGIFELTTYLKKLIIGLMFVSFSFFVQASDPEKFEITEQQAVIILMEDVIHTLLGKGGTLSEFLKAQNYDTYDAYSLLNDHSEPLLTLLNASYRTQPKGKRILNNYLSIYSDANKDIYKQMQENSDYCLNKYQKEETLLLEECIKTYVNGFFEIYKQAAVVFKGESTNFNNKLSKLHFEILKKMLMP